MIIDNLSNEISKVSRVQGIDCKKKYMEMVSRKRLKIIKKKLRLTLKNGKNIKTRTNLKIKK